MRTLIDVEFGDVKRTIGIRLYFDATRTEFVSARAMSPVGSFGRQQFIQDNVTIELRWAPTTKGPFESIGIEIEFEGAQPCFDHHQWLTPAVEDPGVERPALPTAAARTHQRFLKRRERLATLPDTPPKKLRQFFYELDYQTFPGNIDESPGVPTAIGVRRVDQIEAIRLLLKDRFVDRAFAYLDGSEGSFIPRRVSGSNVEAVVQISKLLSGLIERYFTDPAGDLAMTPLEEAFEKFANGELRDQNEGENPDYEPDSGFYFAFAEFALVAIEVHIDQDVWSPLLNALVRTQEVFLSAYQPSPPRSKDRNLITKFHSAEDFAKDKQVDSQGMIAIRQRYHGLDEATLEQAAGWIAFRALKFGKIDNAALDDWKRRFGRCGP